MTLNTIFFFIEIILLLIGSITLASFLFKRRKRSAENIYNLIYDLEKKINSIG